MDKGIILLILNIVLALFLILGFVFGLLKGVKKSGFRIGMFFVAVILAGVLTPLISKLIMQIQITYEGQLMSLSDVIISLINSSPEIADITSSSPSLLKIFQNLPFMIGNIFTFVILLYLINLISWILYLILSSVIFKKNNSLDEKGNIQKSDKKKYRLLGGLIGTIQALILAFLTFLPLSGFVGIITDLSNQTVVQAETQQNTEYSATAKLLNENIPEELKIIIEAYDSSIISSISGVFGLDDAVFNAVSTVKVNDKNISLRDEVINISKVYDNVSYILDLDFSSFECLYDIDFDKLITAVDFIFNSNILKTVLPELIDYGFNMLLEEDNIINNANYKNLIESAQLEINYNNDVVNNLKNEILSVLRTAKVIVSNHILDFVPLDGGEFTTDDISEIIKILSKDNKAVFNAIIDNIFNSRLLNKGVIFALNLGIDYGNQELINLTGDQELDLGNIDIKNSEYDLKKAEVKSLLSSVINIINEIIKVDVKDIKNNALNVFEYDLESLVINVGTMMNAIQNMNVFNNTGIYNKILDALNKTEYNKYIDFEILKGSNIWINETNLVAQSISNLKSSSVISYIDKNDDGYYVTKDNLDKILENLIVISEINGQNKTKMRQIVEPIYNTASFKKIINIGIEQLNVLINDVGKHIDENVELGELNNKNIYNELEKENILSFLDNTIIYLKSLDFNTIQEEPFITFLESNLAQLGSCIDSLRSTTLFDDVVIENNTQKGVLTNLIEALNNTEYSQYINFNCLLDKEFKFNIEFENLHNAIQKLLQKEINNGTNTVNIIDYLSDNGEWSVVLESITSDDLNDIVTPLLNSEIFKPLATIMVNKVNDQIKELVGEYGGVITTVIENLGDEEISQVIEVLSSVTDIIPEITKPDFTVMGLLKSENSEQLSEFLTKLQDNANDDGVFKQTYDAMIEYLKNDEDIGADLLEEINKTQEGASNINWVEFIEKMKNKG